MPRNHRTRESRERGILNKSFDINCISNRLKSAAQNQRQCWRFPRPILEHFRASLYSIGSSTGKFIPGVLPEIGISEVLRQTRCFRHRERLQPLAEIPKCILSSELQPAMDDLQRDEGIRAGEHWAFLPPAPVRVSP